MFERLCFSGATGKPDPSQGGNSLLDSMPAKPQHSKSNKKQKAANSKNACSAPEKAAKQSKHVKMYSYEMFGHVKQTVERYLELTGKTVDSLRKVPTPCIDDHAIPLEEFNVKGELSPVAARIVLKALYVARIGRMDLMWAVNMLAREVTKWTVACDRRLHRMISWMHHTIEHAQINHVGDTPDKCCIIMFCDASFAGDLKDSKSTSGGVLCLVGPNTFVVLNWLCKKQGAVSHSTSEAEIISLDAGARMEALPALLLWDLVIDVFDPPPKVTPKPIKTEETLIMYKQLYDMFGSIDYVPPSLPISFGRAKLYLLEDNDAVIKMIIKERSPAMRHVARTHRVDLDWLFGGLTETLRSLLNS